ncbi:MAG: VTT domain-containing protein [Pirellulaceae bacterium]|nr:VTT domain-containing protein [Pirellulaceae bacterium]
MNHSIDKNQSFESLRGPTRSLRFLLPAALVICGALLIASGVDLRSLQSWLKQAGPGAPILFVLLGITLMSVLLPKTMVSISAGALFGFALGSVLMVVIAFFAALLNYAIGRWWLADSIQRQFAGDTAPPGWARAVRDLAAEAGLGFHLLIRCVPIPSMVISYSMGAASARLVPFLVAATLGVIPQLLWVHGGSLASLAPESAADPRHWAGPVVSIIAAIAFGYIVPREAVRRIRDQQTRSPNPIPAGLSPADIPEVECHR